ncbi:RagB/SusD family nutrient uptake outer membrane protein [Sphingobacterium corticibacterium]|nr:RagB/SusD family nutrient uptake outer membrane protein [Sphingobacterium corticibacterium]
MKRTVFFLTILFCLGCGKSFLEKKTNVSDLTPYRIQDYQALLDDASTMNNWSSCQLGTIAADEIQVDEVALQNFNPYHQRNTYLWYRENLFQGEQSNDWNRAFQRILYCNQVLDGLAGLTPSEGDTEAWNNVKGSALFYRAYAYYQLAQLFCEVYDAETAVNSLGLPLRKEADITVTVGRSNLQDTYDFMLNDLKTAYDLLPLEPLVYERPSRLAVQSLLARIYWNLGKYDEALDESVQVLQTKNILIDYNSVEPNPAPVSIFLPIAKNNPEIIFDATMSMPQIASIGAVAVNETQIELYEEGDLRKNIYFKEFNGFTIYLGSYSSRGAPFSGFSVGELLLVAAECEARKGNLERALLYLNRLRSHRFGSSSFTELISDDQTEILEWILLERRRELVFRGVRWEDIRRLNKEMRFPVTIVKTFLDEKIEIFPGDSRYVFPLPDNAVDLGGLEQNNR